MWVDLHRQSSPQWRLLWTSGGDWDCSEDFCWTREHTEMIPGLWLVEAWLTHTIWPIVARLHPPRLWCPGNPGLCCSCQDCRCSAGGRWGWAWLCLCLWLLVLTNHSSLFHHVTTCLANQDSSTLPPLPSQCWLHNLAWNWPFTWNFIIQQIKSRLITLNPLLATEPSALSLMNILLLVDLMMGGWGRSRPQCIIRRGESRLSPSYTATWS